MPEYGLEEQEKARREGRMPGGLYICPTMAEYFLLLSVYFGESGSGDEELYERRRMWLERNSFQKTAQKPPKAWMYIKFHLFRLSALLLSVS